jgi:hypothetical protein
MPMAKPGQWLCAISAGRLEGEGEKIDLENKKARPKPCFLSFACRPHYDDEMTFPPGHPVERLRITRQRGIPPKTSDRVYQEFTSFRKISESGYFAPQVRRKSLPCCYGVTVHR